MSDNSTFLDTIIQSLQDAGRYNSALEIAPVAVLWPDGDRRWELFVPLLRDRLPVLTLGDYNPEAQSGPPAWLLCMIARVLPSAPPLDTIPVVYLPGISIRELRHLGAENEHLAPLAELVYRGTIWVKSIDYDWTPTAFMQDKESGLGIEIRSDEKTAKSLLHVLPLLAGVSIQRLGENSPWKASDFDALAGFKPEQAEISVEELIALGESERLEFKSTARWDVKESKKNTALEQVIVKTVAAFLNSYIGGTLLIGVEDDGTIHGLDDDYKVWQKPEDRDKDNYEQWLFTMLLNAFGSQFNPYIKVTFHKVQGREVCRVTIVPAPMPVFFEESGPKSKEVVFYIRSGNKSISLNVRDTLLYSMQRWKQN